MKKREELLNKHIYKIWEGTNGKWYTYLPDNVHGRTLKKRNSRIEIEDIIAAYWKEQEENPTVEEVFKEWNDRRLELQKIPAATHWRNEKLFKRFFSEFGKRRIKTINVDCRCGILNYEKLPFPI